MKNAEDWLNSNPYTPRAVVDWIPWIKAIQRDAELEGWKRGMTEAASIWVDRERELSPVGLARKVLSELRDKIKAKRDFKP